jgi:4-hydroxy-3-methylbut-2-enyl diphosphate reductase IspH
VHAERVLLVEPRGFCVGVEMAIKALALMVLRCGPPVYCVHDIVHNDRVVARFRRLGVRFVDRVEQLLRVDGAGELSGVGAVPTVAVTAGASAPEDAVCEVVRALRPVIVERVAPIHERTHFPLPAALRRLLADDDDGAALLALERELSAAELLARVEATMTARAA